MSIQNSYVVGMALRKVGDGPGDQIIISLNLVEGCLAEIRAADDPTERLGSLRLPYIKVTVHAYQRVAIAPTRPICGFASVDGPPQL